MRMPNTFAPRAFEKVVKDRVDVLRMEYAGPAADVKEWHAMVDLLGSPATAEFKEYYSEPGDIPYIVAGFEDDGYDPRGE